MIQAEQKQASGSIAFVIPVLNGDRFIERCLNQISKQMREGDELIIADNGSTDATLDIARRADVRTLVKRGVTIGALRNLGAEATGCSRLAFIDADCLMCDGWRSAVDRVLSDDSVSAVGSFYDLPEQATWVERAWWSFRPRHEHRTSFLISGNLVIRREIFESVGGFDESLVTDEDTDLSRRLIAEQAVLVEAPAARVIHLGNAKSLAAFYKKERWHATGIIGTMGAANLDRPMLMTFVFIAGILGALTCIVLPVAPSLRGFSILMLCPAPVATAGFKVMKHKNFRYFPQLVLLYSLVYIARVAALISGLASKLAGYRSRQRL